MNTNHLFSRVTLLACVASLLIGTPAIAQQEQEEKDSDEGQRVGEVFREALERVMIPKSRLTDGPQVRRAFRDVIASAVEATVRVRCDGKDAALGGIVGPDGWIITKASRLEGQISCRLQDGRELDARIVGVDRQYDLAALKVDAKDLPVVDMLRDSDGDVGQWVATVSTDRDPVAVGVLSVDTRRIRHQPGILGVQLDQVEDGARIVKVFPDTGAADAGILVNDIIVSVNEAKTPNRESLVREIRKYSPGDEVELLVKRDEEEVTVRAVLTGQPKSMQMNRRDYQNSLGSNLSQRRFGFPNALQHDTVLQVDDCGGPLVNLDGQVVGFNISRSGRTESYAIPSNIVVTRMFDLMSGNLAPREDEDLTAPIDPIEESEETEQTSGEEEE